MLDVWVMCLIRTDLIELNWRLWAVLLVWCLQRRRKLAMAIVVGEGDGWVAYVEVYRGLFIN